MACTCSLFATVAIASLAVSGVEFHAAAPLLSARGFSFQSDALVPMAVVLPAHAEATTVTKVTTPNFEARLVPDSSSTWEGTAAGFSGGGQSGLPTSSTMPCELKEARLVTQHPCTRSLFGRKGTAAGFSGGGQSGLPTTSTMPCELKEARLVTQHPCFNVILTCKKDV